MGWLSALVLCTHCGGVAEQDGPGEPRPSGTASVESQAVSCPSETVYDTVGTQDRGDAYVDAAQPTVNFGEADLLLTDGSPRLESYLKFEVTHDDPNIPIVGARLRLFAVDGSTDGPALYRADNEWTEGTLTWNTRPALLGAPLGDLGAVENNSVVEYDVSTVVRSAGDYSFALIPTGGNGVDFESSESTYYMGGASLELTRAITFCARQGTGGALQGVRRYGGPGEEVPRGVAAAQDGGWVVAGRYYNSGDFGGGPLEPFGYLVLAKYGADGSHQWSRTYAPYPGSISEVNVGGLTVTPLGNILVVGSYTGSPDFGTGALPATWGYTPGLFIAKFSPNGTPVWSKGFLAGTPQVGSNTKAPIQGLAVATDAAGSLVVTGTFSGQVNLGGGVLDAGASASGVSALFVARFSWEGDPLWSRVHAAGSTGSEGQALATDSTGAVLLAGVASPHATNTVLGVQGPRTPFVAKYSATGTPLWSRALNGGRGSMRGVVSRPGDAVAFAADFGGTFSFAGRSYSAAPEGSQDGRTDVVLGALSASGSDQWGRQLGGPDKDDVRRLAVDSQGRLTLAGYLGSQADLGGGLIGHPSYPTNYVARYAADGTHLWSRGLDIRLSLTMAGNGAGETLLVDQLDRTVQVDGTAYSPVDGSTDLLLLKLAP
ncbi:DNRLRE domain-containing protein [Corallococcus macrosporus]|uniref:DNRLRE domain-containing protein n=1 Tax=Corallococcus macrosporus TaxID=35 RepID=A0ABS3DM01_9BACT|nr:DNRLRE domain-containing protein [Corallococcus macrosporus]MBN8232367.1 DNRLRE domain-containing protein [Corallococcus macrosporus]